MNHPPPGLVRIEVPLDAADDGTPRTFVVWMREGHGLDAVVEALEQRDPRTFVVWMESLDVDAVVEALKREVQRGRKGSA